MPTSPTSDDTPEWVKGDLPPAPAAGSVTNIPPAARDGEYDTAPATEQPEPREHAAPPGAAAAADGAAEDAAAGHALAEDAAAEDAVAEAAAAKHAVTEEPVAAELPPVTGGQMNGAHDLPEFPHAALDQRPYPAAQPAFSVSLEGADFSLQNTQHAIRNTVPSPDPRPSIEALISTPLSLEAQVESLLFVADGAVPVGRLAEALEVSSRDIEAALAGLSDVYRQRGLSLQRFRDKVQLTTSPAAANRVERFLGLAAATPLSRAALETLAIVAYQQPVTRPQIDSVRGVNSDSVIKNLLGKGLIEELGRAEGPGRPVLYSTTPEFMQHFGLASLSDLPPLSQSGPDASLPPEQILKG